MEPKHLKERPFEFCERLQPDLETGSLRKNKSRAPMVYNYNQRNGSYTAFLYQIMSVCNNFVAKKEVGDCRLRPVGSQLRGFNA